MPNYITITSKFGDKYYINKCGVPELITCDLTIDNFKNNAKLYKTKSGSTRAVNHFFKQNKFPIKEISELSLEYCETYNYNDIIK